jgi:hypothetical protein
MQTVTEATVQRVEELIRADGRIPTDSAVTALGYSHGLAYSIMHDRLTLQKVCALWVPRELKDREKWTEWVCPCNIPQGMQMKEKICLTWLLPGTNHGCITTNPNPSVFQCNGNTPVHFQPKSWRLRTRHQLGMLCLPRFGILREYC